MWSSERRSASSRERANRSGGGGGGTGTSAPGASGELIGGSTIWRARSSGGGRDEPGGAGGRSAGSVMGNGREEFDYHDGAAVAIARTSHSVHRFVSSTSFWFTRNESVIRRTEPAPTLESICLKAF